MSFNEIMNLIWKITITLGYILNTKMIRDLYELNKLERSKNDLREQYINAEIDQLLGKISELELKNKEGEK